MDRDAADKSEYIKMEKGLHKILSLSLDHNGAKDNVENLKECIDLITDAANEALIKDM
jgi:hypothetical protein